MSITVLGGGLGGLSATYYLIKKFPHQKVGLIESSNRLGGWIKSTIQDNFILEQGPRTIRPYGPNGAETLALVENLGISNEVTPISSQSPAVKNRMVYVNGKLHVLPNSLLSLFRKQEPFSKRLVNLIANDFYAPKKHVKDESVYDFVQRRFGSEIADYIISPLICGICAGNSKEISVNFLMKSLFEYEQNYGGVFKGMLKNIFDKKIEPIANSSLLQRAENEKWNVYSFKNGIETLTKSLEINIKSKGNVNIELESKCTDLEIFPDNVIIKLENGKHISSHYIVSSLPAEILGVLVEQQHPELAETLHKIKSVTVAVINFQYGKKLDIKESFGFLVPPQENLPILGVTFDSCYFSRDSNTVLTVMMGGAWFQQLFGENPDESHLLNIAKEQLKKILEITDEPNIVKVNILKNCIPQYIVGHNENIQKINEYIKKHDLPISLCGSSYYGVGINDVIVSAKKAVEALC